MTVTRPDSLPRDEALVATVRAVLRRRLHAMADAVVDDLMADVMLALIAPEPAEERLDDHLPALQR